MNDQQPPLSFTDRIFRKKPVEVSIPARELLGRPPIVKSAAVADEQKAPDVLARFLKDLPVQEFAAAKSIFLPGSAKTIKVRGTPYGFISADIDYVPIGMALWCGRSETVQRLTAGSLTAIVVTQPAIYAAHLLPESEAMRKMLIRSRLIEIDGVFYRSRHDQVSTGRFTSKAIDDSLPIIFVAPSPVVMAELKRRVLAVNVGTRAVTLNFD